MNVAMDYLNGYVAPKSQSHYTKLQKGENRLRLLSKPVFGWEDWIENKPIRYELHNKPSKSSSPDRKVKEFWAFIVYNYDTQRIELMSTDKATIRKSIQNLCADADWGSPFFYDIKILRSGEGKDTEYVVNPLPRKPVDPSILEAFRDRPCNLNALFTGLDPWSEESTKEYFTPLADEEPKVIPLKEEKLTVAEVTELAKSLGGMPKEFCDEVQAFMKKQKIENYDDIPRPMYERLMKKIKGGN